MKSVEIMRRGLCHIRRYLLPPSPVALYRDDTHHFYSTSCCRFQILCFPKLASQSLVRDDDIIINRRSFNRHLSIITRTNVVKKTFKAMVCNKYFSDSGGLKQQRHLQGVEDNFKGIWVDLNQFWTPDGPENLSDELFNNLLSDSLNHWRNKNVNSVWLKVPICLSSLISVASKHHFQYHHAEGSTAVLCLWMNGNSESRIPSFASHQIGVSGVVINESKREVLMVRDKNKKRKLWKFPGGLSDLGEDIADTARREVYEETGIQTEFKSVLAFRQQHDQPNAFGRSDIYILCRMEPLSFRLNPCAEEIEAAEWVSVDQLPHRDNTSAFSRRVADLILRGLQEGFHQVDIEANPVDSIYKKIKVQMFHRPLKLK